MSTAIIITGILLGTLSAALISRAYPIARALWPGPSVKGPGDVYVQAFQTLLCVVVLGLIAAAASIFAFILSRRVGWSLGQWLSALPVLTVAVMLALMSISRGR